MANIQQTRSRGEGTKEVKNNMALQKLIGYQALLFFKAKIWSAGEELAGPPRTCLLHRAHLCVRTVTPALRRYAYRQSSLGILAPVAHSLREGSVVTQGLQFLSCLCLMSTAPNQAKCTLLLLHGPGNYQIQMLLTGACPGGSYPLSFPVYRNW